MVEQDQTGRTVAGYLPGLLIGLALLIVAAGYARKHKLPAGERVSLKQAGQRSLAALPSLLLIFIVIGGILGGLFTATEAGAVAAHDGSVGRPWELVHQGPAAAPPALSS